MKPKIAWVTYDLPYPPNSGGKLRAFNLIKNLSRDFDIHLYSFYRNGEQLKFLDKITPFVTGVKVYRRGWVWNIKNLLLNLFYPQPLLSISYLNRELREDLLTAVKEKKFDLFHFEFLGTASYLCLVKERGGKVLMGNENVEYKIYDAYAKQSKFYPLIPLYKYDVWKMTRFEQKLWLTADANIAVSVSDARVVGSITQRVCPVVPNGVEIVTEYPLKRSKGPVAYFAGDLKYQQNRDAVVWFLESVYPLVKDEVPDFKLIILSNNSPKFMDKYRKFSEVVGDSQSHFEDFVPLARIFISPIRIKSGTNIKILQAAAAGLPIVCTQASISGYDFEDGRDVLVAREPKDFAKAVITLLKDPQLQTEFSSRALAKVKKYSWENSAKILKDVYTELLS